MGWRLLLDEPIIETLIILESNKNISYGDEELKQTKKSKEDRQLINRN